MSADLAAVIPTPRFFAERAATLIGYAQSLDLRDEAYGPTIAQAHACAAVAAALAATDESYRA